jgi:5-formyltetrahydrofolate cyclo-ligase
MATERNSKSKTSVRAECQIRLKALVGTSLEESQLNLSLQLSSFLKEQKGRWGAYRPLPGEASPTLAIQNNQHLHWVYPRVASHSLDFFLDPKVWLKGPFGVEEPDPTFCESVELRTLEGYLIPGLGFDRSGTRLGRGKGYFDRALEYFEGLKVGVAFEVQILAEPIPRESFDIPMDVIITDRGVIFTH